MILSTIYRSKLDPSHSFPIGAEKLSTALDGIPDFSDYKIYFSDVVSAWKSQFKQILETGTPYTIVSARIRGEKKIGVYPVPRALKYQVHLDLLSFGLPQMRSSMCRMASLPKDQGASCDIMFYHEPFEIFVRERAGGKENDLHSTEHVEGGKASPATS